MRTFSSILALETISLSDFSGASLLAQDQQQPAAATSKATPSTAQPRHAPNPQRQAKKMSKELGLTPDQESKLEPILADKQQEMESAKADTTLAPIDRRARVRSINQDSDANESVARKALRI